MMTDSASNTWKGMVLTDEAGNYYLLPRATVEQGRVPAEQRAEIERRIGGEDVAGFQIKHHKGDPTGPSAGPGGPGGPIPSGGDDGGDPSSSTWSMPQLFRLV